MGSLLAWASLPKAREGENICPHATGPGQKATVTGNCRRGAEHGAGIESNVKYVLMPHPLHRGRFQDGEWQIRRVFDNESSPILR